VSFFVRSEVREGLSPLAPRSSFPCGPLLSILLYGSCLLACPFPFLFFFFFDFFSASPHAYG